MCVYAPDNLGVRKLDKEGAIVVINKVPKALALRFRLGADDNGAVLRGGVTPVTYVPEHSGDSVNWSSGIRDPSPFVECPTIGYIVESDWGTFTRRGLGSGLGKALNRDIEVTRRRSRHDRSSESRAACMEGNV